MSLSEIILSYLLKNYHIIILYIIVYYYIPFVRGKERISFVLVPDLIVTSRQNRKWQGSLLADSNQTKTSTNTNQKAGTCDIRLEKETLRILRDTYHVFMVIPNFLVQTYPSHSRLQLVSTERFFC